MVLNEVGVMVQKVWNDLPSHYCNITLDMFVVMPNHFHGIIAIQNSKFTCDVRAGLKPAPTRPENF